MPALVEFGLTEFAVALGVLLSLAALFGVAWYTFRAQKKTVAASALKDWRDVADAQGEKIRLLEEGLKQCRSEHERCERRINRISAFNLRLQARESRYQKQINRLEGALELDVTDFSEVGDAPQDSDFG